MNDDGLMNEDGIGESEVKEVSIFLARDELFLFYF